MQRRCSVHVWMCFRAIECCWYTWMHSCWWYGVNGSSFLCKSCQIKFIGSFFFYYCWFISLFKSCLQGGYCSCICRLGKTLQSIALLYTLLCQGFDGKPMVKKAIIVTPTSLVSNWEAEIKKWVGGRVQLIALCESTRDDVVSGIDSFTNPCSSLQVNFCCYVWLFSWYVH